MSQADTVAFTRRLLNHVSQNSSDHAAGPITEGSDFFTAAERWHKEREQFFLGTPQVLGFAGEVASAGTFITVESMGIPIVICRDVEGNLHAFVNACAHRGARVAEGCGTAKRLTCKFHGWSYSLAGVLAGRPQDAAFATADAGSGLISLPVSDNAGLLVVGLRPDISQHAVDHALDDIAPVLTDFGFATMHTLETRRYAVAANWKLVTNLSHESYHFRVLHRESLAALMTDHAVVDDFGKHSRWGFPLCSITELTDKPEKDWPARLPGAINHTLFPSTVLISSGTDAQLIRAEPGATPGDSIVYYSGVCGDAHNRESSLAAYEFGGDIFHNEDLPIAEQCQQGIAARQTKMTIGANEPVVQLWHKKWRSRLQ